MLVRDRCASDSYLRHRSLQVDWHTRIGEAGRAANAGSRYGLAPETESRLVTVLGSSARRHIEQRVRSEERFKMISRACPNARDFVRCWTLRENDRRNSVHVGLSHRFANPERIRPATDMTLQSAKKQFLPLHPCKQRSIGLSSGNTRANLAGKSENSRVSENFAPNFATSGSRISTSDDLVRCRFIE